MTGHCFIEGQAGAPKARLGLSRRVGGWGMGLQGPMSVLRVFRARRRRFVFPAPGAEPQAAGAASAAAGGANLLLEHFGTRQRKMVFDISNTVFR